LAIEWGSDINDLVTELEQQQQKLKELYDRAALQVPYSAFLTRVQFIALGLVQIGLTA
jgi:hypothetical protein